MKECRNQAAEGGVGEVQYCRESPGERYMCLWAYTWP